MILFQTGKRPLTYLLDQVVQGQLALPDFQRSFVWDANATRELIASIITSYRTDGLGPVAALCSRDQPEHFCLRWRQSIGWPGSVRGSGS